MRDTSRLVEVAKGRWVMTDAILGITIEMGMGNVWYVETKLRDQSRLEIREMFFPDPDKPSPYERAHAYAARIVRDCNL